jgi:hypothetical protein
MTFLWITISILVAIVWVLSIVDIVRHRYSTGVTIAWLVAVLLFPFVGAFAYWIWRKPTAAEAEAAYLGEAELRRSAAHQSPDRTGWGS